MTARLDRVATLVLAEQTWGSTLHAMRSAHRAGTKVLVAVAGEGASIYRRSRSCFAAVDLPLSDETDEGQLAPRLNTFIQQFAPEVSTVVVVPLSDRLVALLDRHRDELDPRCSLAIASNEVTDALLDKRTSLLAASAAGLDVPTWCALSCPADLDEVLGGAAPQGLGPPFALRPASWQAQGDLVPKIARLDDARALADLARPALELGIPLILQRFVPVEEDHVEFALTWRSADGSTIEIRTGRKHRQSRREGGVMVWGEAVELSDVRAATEQFLDHTGHTGPGGIEFLRENGTLQFVEFNPRLEAIHFLATAAGMDTVALAISDARSAPPSPTSHHSASAWIGSAALERWRSDPSGRCALLGDRVSAFRRNATRAVWTWRDPGPGLAVASRLVRHAFSSQRRLMISKVPA